MSWRMSWVALLLAFGVSGACAQGAYPNKPVRLIVPFAPGGSNDIVARIIGYKFADSMAQQFIIDNRGGASGVIGTDLAAKVCTRNCRTIPGKTCCR
jgi:tripartite-type tricarboxylate transporter receptor subunit TctC